MESFEQRNAFVTGAANGIGLGIARNLARAGANLALADIDGAALDKARADVAQFGTKVITLELDVSERAAVESSADEVESQLGNVHLVFNNAGISIGQLLLTEIDEAQWNWLFGVNVLGVVHGVSTFVPRMRAHGEGGHVVNTAAMGGLRLNPAVFNGSQPMASSAIVALSEELELELENTDIGVSVLCPSTVRNTTLGHSAKRRPERFGGPYEPTGPAENPAVAFSSEALEPDEIGARVLQAIANEEFYILTHVGERATVEARYERILAAFDAASKYDATHSQSEDDNS